MKTILIGFGIMLIGLSLFVGFGITVSSLKESDEEIFKYLTIPTLMLGLGIYLVVKGKKLRSS